MKKVISDWLNNEKNKELVEFIKSIVFALVIALVLRSSVVEANYIFSGSMTPTLLAGDYVLVNKMAYALNLRIPYYPITLARFSTPKHGDIVTFIYPQDNSKIFVKRVMGLPGDVIEIKNKQVYINNESIKLESKEDYENYYLAYKEFVENHPHMIIHRKEQSIYGDFGPIKVSENCYFVLGDNRDNSADSRFWGFVPAENVLGKSMIIYFSNSETLFPSMNSFSWETFSPVKWLQGIRWKRFGTITI